MANLHEALRTLLIDKQYLIQDPTNYTALVHNYKSQQIAKSAINFAALLTEKAHSTNSTTTEIANHLSTDLSPSA